MSGLQFAYSCLEFLKRRNEYLIKIDEVVEVSAPFTHIVQWWSRDAASRWLKATGKTSLGRSRISLSLKKLRV
jgi:hypothetical protein